MIDMKPGDLVRWTGDGMNLIHTGDLILVIERVVQKTSNIEYVRFLSNGVILEITKRWFLLNTETIDGSR